MISYTRRKDREFVELPKPRLSALLSGTPRQILALVPDTENGLFSRFIFYYMNIRLEWKNVFAESQETLDESFKTIGYEFYELAKYMGKKVICISDMYLPADVVSKIIINNGYDVDVIKKYDNIFKKS